MCKIKSTKGITLVALVVTIVVLLILAGITINYLLGPNSIFNLAREAAERTNQAVENEQRELENLINYIKEEGWGSNQPSEWTQNKTSVTNGTITLEVGQVVSGYTVTDEEWAEILEEYADWCVLGAKDGKLLITTNGYIEPLEVQGASGFTVNLDSTGNEELLGKYINDEMTESARSINVDDINRVTGYNPAVAQYHNGQDEIDQWGNIVTFTKKELAYENNIHLPRRIEYVGTKYPTTKLVWYETYYEEYWDGSNWIETSNGESVTITNDYYAYYPQTLTTEESSEMKINGSTKAYDLLFNFVEPYWLNSTYSCARDECYAYGRRIVEDGQVCGMDLTENGRYLSTHGAMYSLRPVISLKSDVKVTSDGTLSM